MVNRIAGEEDRECSSAAGLGLRPRWTDSGERESPRLKRWRMVFMVEFALCGEGRRVGRSGALGCAMLSASLSDSSSGRMVRVRASPRPLEDSGGR